MTTTPTIWKSTFFPNFAAPAGNQSVPQTIGLANGNILVVWEDDTQGPSAGIDVMGRIFTPEGNPASNPFQVNYTITISDETGPKIVAMPDGGFVMAYGSYDSFLGGFLVVERFNSTGGSISSRFILDDRNSLTKFELTADNNGNYIVAFHRDVEHVIVGGILGDERFFSQDVRAVVYNNLSNSASPEYSAAQNANENDSSGAPDNLGGIAAFADGTVITVSDEWDNKGFEGSYTTVEFMITQPSTGDAVVAPVHVNGSPDHRDRAEGVAVLTGGQFVLVYRHEYGYASNNIVMRIGAGNTPGSQLGLEIAVTQGNSVEFDPRVVALRDGGFIVVWDDYTTDSLLGTRYTLNGTAIGDAGFLIATGVGRGSLGLLSLTSDGRVLVPFRSTNGEISEVILDPRDNIIYGTALGEVLTTQVGKTLIFGEGGDDTILGQGGNDFIHGGTGRDDLRGGAEDDTLYGEDGIDVLRGGVGNDTYVLDDANSGLFGDVSFYDTIIESVGQGTDVVLVRALDVQLFGVDGYTLGNNIENGAITGTPGKFSFFLTGNALNNVLAGNAGSNTLNGLGGADSMTGGAGNDQYYVDNASDVVNEAGGGGSDTVITSVRYTLLAGSEVELLRTFGSTSKTAINLTGNAVAQTLQGNAAANTLNGGGGGDVMQGFAGNDSYFVDNAADTIVETANQGTDSVRASTSYTLGANQSIEVLQTLGAVTTYNVNLNGNSFVNTVFGNAGANVINGRAGSDTLAGFGGSDIFRFDTALGASNIDTVNDFNVAADTIQLQNSVFAGLVDGTLNADAFHIGAAAADAEDRIIYNNATGVLIFDSNGSAAGGAVQFATLSTGLALTNADFVVI